MSAGLTESVGALGLLVVYVLGGTDWFGEPHEDPPRWSLASRWKFVSKEAPTVSVAIFGGHRISRSLCVSTNG
nr:unnamed protein product [Digitaria exilis]